jgi:hypothetical protein
MAARRIVTIFVFALGCATAPDRLDAHNPGDRCIETCPEGMRCEGTTTMKAPKKTYPGRCVLLAGRCATDPDCARGERCVRSSERLGLCAPSSSL